MRAEQSTRERQKYNAEFTKYSQYICFFFINEWHNMAIPRGKEIKIMKILKKIAKIVGEVCSVNAGIDFYAG